VDYRLRDREGGIGRAVGAQGAAGGAQPCGRGTPIPGFFHLCVPRGLPRPPLLARSCPTTPGVQRRCLACVVRAVGTESGAKSRRGGAISDGGRAGTSRRARRTRTGGAEQSRPHPLCHSPTRPFSHTRQLKTPWACRPFAAAAVTAGELALLAHLDWRTSSPTPCDFAGALVRLALPGPDAAPARAAAGQVSDAAIEAASTGRAGAATAAARPSAIGAAAALIGLHGAGRGEAAAVFLGMMDEVRGWSG